MLRAIRKDHGNIYIYRQTSCGPCNEPLNLLSVGLVDGTMKCTIADFHLYYKMNCDVKPHVYKVYGAGVVESPDGFIEKSQLYFIQRDAPRINHLIRGLKAVRNDWGDIPVVIQCDWPDPEVDPVRQIQIFPRRWYERDFGCKVLDKAVILTRSKE